MGCIELRRSVRAFEQRDIPGPVLEQILRAGLLAPSPKNRQPWDFVVLRRGGVREGLLESLEDAISGAFLRMPGRAELGMALDSLKAARQASVLVLVCYRTGTAPVQDDGVRWPLMASDREVLELQAVGAAAENMLLKAVELGLGGFWCGDVLYGYQTIMDYLKLEEPVVSALAFGYPLEMPTGRPRDAVSVRCRFL